MGDMYWKQEYVHPLLVWVRDRKKLVLKENLQIIFNCRIQKKVFKNTSCTIWKTAWYTKLTLYTRSEKISNHKSFLYIVLHSCTIWNKKKLLSQVLNS